MKKRTRVLAWIFAVGASLGILRYVLTVLGFLIHPEKYTAHPCWRIFMVINLVECLFLTVGWSNLLKRRAWAWRLLLWLSLVLIVHFLVGIAIESGHLSGNATYAVFVFLIQCGLPLWVLLTDRPSGWYRAANPQSEIPNPQ